MPKRRGSAYYSELAKRRFTKVDSVRSHVESPRVSLDAIAHVDCSLRVSVDATSRMGSVVDTTSRIESSGDISSGTKIIV